ncbi:hypothetical protein BH11MYX2_BH11MYX2_33830 [soil metagenome]
MIRLAPVCLLAALALAACHAPQRARTAAKVVDLVIKSDSIEGRKRPAGLAPNSPQSSQILLLAIDGASRDQLYELLRAGQLPNLAELLGGDSLAHAYLDEHFLSNLPSTTMPAWSSALTGVGAAETGVPNNEYWIRETKTFACPAPVTFSDAAPTLEIYTDGYLGRLIEVPTVYERIHEQDPAALVWVVMNHVFRGADRTLLTKRTVMLRAFEGFAEKVARKVLTKEESRKIYADLDNAAIENLTSKLKDGPTPDVLTLYISGTDLYAHIATEGPDEARREYLTEVVNPALAKVVKAMRERNMLENRWVIVTADHGHTQVIHDEQHAIGTSEEDTPGVLHKVGFKTRPFEREVSKHDTFNSVLAYGGAIAFVYLADRSKCDGTKPCAWTDPPRYREDVLAVADALYRSNEDGVIATKMKGTLDMVLVRRPKPVAEVDLPFEVYIGDGHTQSIDAYLNTHPHRTYIDVAGRLKELAVGPHGERAGDIMLIAHNGDRATPEERFYFEAVPYRSWHGSPSKQDSEIPLIVANPRHSTTAIQPWVNNLLGSTPYQRKLTDIMLGLRTKPPH